MSDARSTSDLAAPSRPRTTAPGPHAGEFAGWTRISPRAIRAISTAIVARELNTEPRTVSIDLGDENGALVVAVSAPVGVVPLTRRVDARGAGRPTILERGSQLQSSVSAGLLELSGSTVGRVDVRFTSARVETRGRVK